MVAIQSPDFNIEKIADSGQCFRLNPMENGRYRLVALGRVLELEPRPDGGLLHCSQTDYERIWRAYFDMDADYAAYRAAIPPADGYLTRAAQFGAGVRILRQDFWEMLVTFLISQRKNIPAIKGCVEALCRLCGEKLAHGLYAFPTPEAVARLTADELNACSLGYRAGYVQRAARRVAGGGVDLAALEALPTEALLAALQDFPGVGPKVAHCILLFGFHRLDAFPRDVWINRVVDREYGGCFPLELYRGFEGVIQQYLFFYARSGGGSSGPFTGFRRHTADGVTPIAAPSPTDNLVIHGDNLPALRGLLERYRGQVKCVYIDPPYNTGSGAFSYRDRFPRDEWLRFLEERLTLARDLLSPDGAIYVQLDYHQVHYVKVLMDRLFGEENFQREIIWRIGWVSGYKTAANNYIRNHDTLLFYSKDASQMAFYKQYLANSEFRPRIKPTKAVRDALLAQGLTARQVGAVLEEINHTSRPERYPIEDVWNANEYDDLNSIAITSFSGETVSKMLDCPEVKGQKSEKLIARILAHHTMPGDLVLDFFSGTGTTAAVAHKMGRRFLTCELLDAHYQITVNRLAKVLGGEQSGVSKPCQWRGGGSFVTCSLK